MFHCTEQYCYPTSPEGSTDTRVPAILGEQEGVVDGHRLKQSMTATGGDDRKLSHPTYVRVAHTGPPGRQQPAVGSLPPRAGEHKG